MPPPRARGRARCARAACVKRYGGRTVVDGVDLHLERGEIVALLGPNGAGKTTSFYMMVGFVRPDGGRIELGDRTSPAGPCTGAPGPGSATWRRSRRPSGA
jgi:lipopolysaccharide export system ATP-binding protein